MYFYVSLCVSYVSAMCRYVLNLCVNYAARGVYIDLISYIIPQHYLSHISNSS